MAKFACAVLNICAAVYAEAACTSSVGYSVTVADTIGVRVGSGWIDAPPITSAINMWSCGGDMGDEFPQVLSNTTGDITISVSRLSGRNPEPGSGCARFNHSLDSSNRVIGGAIEVYQQDHAGNDCLWVMPNVTLDNLIAHELGHVLGLANSSCSSYIMGPNWSTSSVNSAECSWVDNRWEQSSELPERDDCGACWTTCNPDNTCPPPPTSTPPNWQSPIVIDLDQDGYELCGTGDAVAFDLNADGRAEWTTWTTRGSDDAFLALDKNRNGKIDGGAELFGDAVPLANGTLPVSGFDVLAEFDDAAHGGNGDAHIDSEDAVWSDLLLWIDANHDGDSNITEIRRLSSAVMSIDTRYTYSGRRDRHGNLLRFKAKALVIGRRGGLRMTSVYDVFFQSP
jgi:hypothetical protein